MTTKGYGRLFWLAIATAAQWLAAGETWAAEGTQAFAAWAYGKSRGGR